MVSKHSFHLAHFFCYDEHCVLCTLEITDWDQKSSTKSNGYFWATFNENFQQCTLCPHQTLTTRSLLVASPVGSENKGTASYSFAHLSPNVYHCQRMIWHWAPTVLGKTGAGLWKETPFCGRPRKPRPLISAFCHNINSLNYFRRRC